MANLFAVIATFPAYSLEIGSTPFQSGLQNTVFGLSAVVLRMILGPIMDHKGAKPLMLIGAFAFATTPLIVMLSTSYWLLLVARVYQAIGLAVFMPGISSILAELAPANRLGTYLGGMRIFFNLGLMAGPATALFLIDNSGYNSWFAVSAVIGFLSLLMFAAVKTSSKPAEAPQSVSGIQNIREALKTKALYPIFGGITLMALVYSGVVSFSAVHLADPANGVTAAQFFVIFGVTGMVGALSVGAISDRIERSRIAWPLLAVLGAGSIIYAFVPLNPALLVVSAIILGLGLQGSSLVLSAWLLLLAKPGLRVTTVSLQENTVDIGFATGAFIFGLAAQGPGIGSAFIAMGLIIILAVIPFNRLARSYAEQ